MLLIACKSAALSRKKSNWYSNKAKKQARDILALREKQCSGTATIGEDDSIRTS